MLILNMFNMSFAKIAVAAIWLYQGLWCKLLRHSPHQAGIVAGVPGLNPNLALPTIGAAEFALAVWVLSGRRGRLAAVVQTMLLAAMNGAGLLWAGRMIADPAGMLLQNLAFLCLAWVVAEEPVAEKSAVGEAPRKEHSCAA